MSSPRSGKRRGPLRRAFKHASRWLALRAVPLLAFLLYLVARTWRVRLVNWKSIGDEHARGKSVIYAIGHGRMLANMWVMRHRGVRVLISEHFDGELITRVIECFGFGAARGSATRGGARALRELVREAERYDLAVTPDGPRGPFLSVKPGLPFLAARTGLAIVAGSYDADWRLQFRSWDSFRIPLPFARVYISIAEPRRIPADADDARLEEERQAIERDLRAVDAHATELARRPVRERVREASMVRVPPCDKLVDVGGKAWEPKRPRARSESRPDPAALSRSPS